MYTSKYTILNIYILHVYAPWCTVLSYTTVDLIWRHLYAIKPKNVGYYINLAVLKISQFSEDLIWRYH